MINRYLVFMILLLSGQFCFSQNKIDTVRIVFDSLTFSEYVICQDMETKTGCTDSIYTIASPEDMKNAFLRYEDYTIKSTLKNPFPPDKYKQFRDRYMQLHTCRHSLTGIHLPVRAYSYIILMYLTIHCDSISVMEGLFYQNMKDEMYFGGIYKEYDLNGRLITEGNYFFTKEGARNVEIS
jgi:hypothetical protein